MHAYLTFSSFLMGAVVLGFINQRFWQVQATIAMMASTIVISVLILALDKMHIKVISPEVLNFIANIDFNDILINGFLSFLLFAGALSIDYEQFKKDLKTIMTLAFVSTAISTLLISYLTYWMCSFAGLGLTLLQCSLFGALISPTDPIATIATLKSLNGAKKISTRIAGEALFNDGIGIVIFLTLLGMNFANSTFQLTEFSWLFIREAGGGIVWGLILGNCYNYLNRHNQEIFINIMLTLIITMWGYAWAQDNGISGPLAIVTAGLIIGRNHRTSQKSYTELINFWIVIEEILNYVLFLMMGLELLNINMNSTYIILGLTMIPVTLGARYISIRMPLTFMRQDKRLSETGLMVWGGLRGGLAIALALALPPSTIRDIFITMTYTVVIFSVIVQGLTISRFAIKESPHDECST